MDYQTIRVAEQDGYAVIQLMRPDVMNALNGQMRAELLHAIKEAPRTARAVVLTGSGKAELEAQGFFFPPAVLRWPDVSSAVGLSLGLSFIITYFPARRAARMNPVEALRYE